MERLQNVQAVPAMIGSVQMIVRSWRACTDIGGRGGFIAELDHKLGLTSPFIYSHRRISLQLEPTTMSDAEEHAYHGGEDDEMQDENGQVEDEVEEDAAGTSERRHKRGAEFDEEEEEDEEEDEEDEDEDEELSGKKSKKRAKVCHNTSTFLRFHDIRV